MSSLGEDERFDEGEQCDTHLCGYIRSREVQSLIQIVRLVPIHKLRHHLPVPGLVELVHEHAVELRQVLDDADDDLEERLEVVRRAELLVDLRHNREHVHHAHRALPAPPPRSGAAEATRAGATTPSCKGPASIA